MSSGTGNAHRAEEDGVGQFGDAIRHVVIGVAFKELLLGGVELKTDRAGQANVTGAARIDQCSGVRDFVVSLPAVACSLRLARSISASIVERAPSTSPRSIASSTGRCMASEDSVSCAAVMTRVVHTSSSERML